jgi:hypothetical protein
MGSPCFPCRCHPMVPHYAAGHVSEVTARIALQLV